MWLPVWEVVLKHYPKSPKYSDWIEKCLNFQSRHPITLTDVLAQPRFVFRRWEAKPEFFFPYQYFLNQCSENRIVSSKIRRLRVEMSPLWAARRLRVERGIEMCQIWKVSLGWRIERQRDADLWWAGLIPGTFGNEYVTGLLNTKLHLIHPGLLAVPQALSGPIPGKVRCSWESP